MSNYSTNTVATKTSDMVALTVLVWVQIFSLTNATAGNSVLERFPAPQKNFQQHIEEMREYLLDTQLADRSAADVQFNLPFELKANSHTRYQGKYLLIHGLDDSPEVWRDAAKALATRGYDVRAILLPGHGNTPEAQLNVSYLDWLNAARTQYELWRTPGTSMHVGGFSLGAVIATTLALEYDNINGLFLFSPAYSSTKDNLLRWASLVSHFKPWVFGHMIIEDNPARYNSIPINAMAQYYKTTKYLKKKLRHRKLEMPVFMVATLDDSVVNIKKVRDIFRTHFTSPNKRLVLYGNLNVQENAFEVVRKSEYLEYRILNQSHMSTIISPDNALYGINGAQLVCNGNEWEVFSACLYYQGGKRWHGAEGTPSPDGIPMARTTFNPDFNSLMTLYDQVFLIDGTSQPVIPNKMSQCAHPTIAC